jgi:hypothetical protein
MLKPLFKQPVGASKQCFTEPDEPPEETPQVIVCEICGSESLKTDSNGNSSNDYFHFLGYRGVLQCCGKLIDILYQQWGKEFFERTLSDFKNNPRSCDNHFIRAHLEDTLRLWKEKSG